MIPRGWPQYGGCAAGRWPARTPAAATASRSPPTSAKAPASTGRSLEFSHAYAEQNERDYQALAAAVKAGKIVAETGL